MRFTRQWISKRFVASARTRRPPQWRLDLRRSNCMRHVRTGHFHDLDQFALGRHRCAPMRCSAVIPAEQGRQGARAAAQRWRAMRASVFHVHQERRCLCQRRKRGRDRQMDGAHKRDDLCNRADAGLSPPPGAIVPPRLTPTSETGLPDALAVSRTWRSTSAITRGIGPILRPQVQG